MGNAWRARGRGVIDCLHLCCEYSNYELVSPPLFVSLPPCFTLISGLGLKPSDPGCTINKRVLTEALIEARRLTVLISRNNDH